METGEQKGAEHCYKDTETGEGQQKSQTMALNNFKGWVLRRNRRRYLMDEDYSRPGSRVIRGRESACWGEGLWWGGQLGARHRGEWLSIWTPE